MNLKYPTTSLLLVLIAMSAISVMTAHQDAFAQGTGMSITATAEEGSDTITIKGQTTSKSNDVTFLVTSPTGNRVDAGQVQPNLDGSFDTMFTVGELWTENGFYTIQATQGKTSFYNMEVSVEIRDGMTMETTERNGILGGIMTEPDRAEKTGLSIKANAVIGSTTIGITGTTDKTNVSVTLAVTSPNGNVVNVGQVSPNMDGTFATDITTGGPLWKQDGLYTVSAQQGTDQEYMDSTTVDIEDGKIVPEFGTIAVMILVVAIISIIAISARSRLSIIPRY